MAPEHEPASPPTGTAGDGDWPARAADLVDALVSLLRDKAVRPVALAARALVFGILVLTAAIVLAVLVSLTVIRLLTVYAFNGRVWLSDLVVGALFVLLGLVAWAQRRGGDAAGRDA